MFWIRKKSFRVFCRSIVSIKQEPKPRPHGARIGWGKDVIFDLIPFTAELITSKGRAFEQLAASYCPPQKQIAFATSSAGERRVEDSWLELILPLSDHLDLRNCLVSDSGNAIRYGRLFEILDSLAADVAYRHCDDASKADHCEYCPVLNCFI